MTIVRELITKLGYRIDDRQLNRYNRQIDRTDREVRQLNRTTDRSARSIARQTAVMGTATVALGNMAAAAAGVVLQFARIAVTEFFRGLVTTNIEFQRIEASLVTLTGSAEAAQVALDGIKAFAETTPFALRDVAQAFVRLKGVGIDPTIETLTSFANTAAGTTGDLLQFVEAVADASTFQFERLPEFGIVARTEGDKIRFIFDNTETVISKNKDAIVGFLTEIGNVKFAGGIERQLATIGGQLSLVGDNLDKFFVAVGEAGFNQAFLRLLGFLRDTLAGGGGLADLLGVGLGRVIDGTINGIQRLLDVGQDLQVFFAGGDSLIGRILGPEASGLIRDVVSNVERLQPVFAEIGARLLPEILLAFESLKPDIAELGDALRELFVEILGPGVDESASFPEIIRSMIPGLVEAIRQMTRFVRLWLQLLTIVTNLVTFFRTTFPNNILATTGALQTAIGAIENLMRGILAAITGDFDAATQRWIGFIDGVSEALRRLGNVGAGFQAGFEQIPGVRSVANLTGIGPAARGRPGGTGGTTNANVNNTATVGTQVFNFTQATPLGPDQVALAAQTGTSQGLADQLKDIGRNTLGALT